MSRSLALDVGDERIGVALSDQRGYMARPLEVIPRRAGPSSYQRLSQLVAEHDVDTLVVGLPLLADGSEGAQAASVRAYVRGMGSHLSTPIVYWDERYSTRRAGQILAEIGGSRRRHARRADAVAAAVILQEYLDARRASPSATA